MVMYIQFLASFVTTCDSCVCGWTKRKQESS